MGEGQEAVGAEGVPALIIDRWRSDRGLREVAVVLGAAVVLQILVGYRNDCAAHLIVGSAVFLAAGLVVPSSLAMAVGERWHPWLGLGVPAALIVAAEWTLLGPFDPLDVSFSLLGGLLVASTVIGLSCADGVDRSTRLSLARAAVVLALAAILVRYGHTLFGLDFAIWSNSR